MTRFHDERAELSTKKAVGIGSAFDADGLDLELQGAGEAVGPEGAVGEGVDAAGIGSGGELQGDILRG